MVRKVLREVLSHSGRGATGHPLTPEEIGVITPYAGQVGAHGRVHGRDVRGQPTAAAVS